MEKQVSQRQTCVSRGTQTPPYDEGTQESQPVALSKTPQKPRGSIRSGKRRPEKELDRKKHLHQVDLDHQHALAAQKCFEDEQFQDDMAFAESLQNELYGGVSGEVSGGVSGEVSVEDGSPQPSTSKGLLEKRNPDESETSKSSVDEEELTDSSWTPRKRQKISVDEDERYHPSVTSLAEKRSHSSKRDREVESNSSSSAKKDTKRRKTDPERTATNTQKKSLSENTGKKKTHKGKGKERLEDGDEEEEGDRIVDWLQDSPPGKTESAKSLMDKAMLLVPSTKFPAPYKRRADSEDAGARNRKKAKEECNRKRAKEECEKNVVKEKKHSEDADKPDSEGNEGGVFTGGEKEGVKKGDDKEDKTAQTIGESSRKEVNTSGEVEVPQLEDPNPADSRKPARRISSSCSTRCDVKSATEGRALVKSHDIKVLDKTQ